LEEKTSIIDESYIEEHLPWADALLAIGFILICSKFVEILLP
jgi:hypothetical protein